MTAVLVTAGIGCSTKGVGSGGSEASGGAGEDGGDTGTVDSTDGSEPDLPPDFEAQPLFLECQGQDGGHGGEAPLMWLCDGWPDCPFADDELPGQCDAPPEFVCDNGEAIPWPATCPEEGSGCGDGTDDEAFCTQFDEWYFSCDPGLSVSHGPRIPIAWVCDGTGDCNGVPGAEEWDEENYGCEHVSFECDEGVFTGFSMCDGHALCADFSDEPSPWCSRWVKGGSKKWIP